VSRIAARSATSPIKPEPSRFQRKPAEATSPVKKPAEVRRVPESTTPARRAIPTYQRPTQQTARTTTTTTSTLRQTTQQQKTTALKNGRSLSGSKLVEPKVQKESPKVAAPKQIVAPSVKVSLNKCFKRALIFGLKDALIKIVPVSVQRLRSSFLRMYGVRSW
jgi:hypothetical protein